LEEYSHSTRRGVGVSKHFIRACNLLPSVPILSGVVYSLSTSILGFYINLPIGGVAAFILVLSYIPDQITVSKGRSAFRTAVENFDLLGFAIFAPAAIQVLLALQYGGNQYAWNSATVIGLFCGGGVMFLLFLVWEHRKGDDAMIPFSMVSNRVVWCSCLVMLFLMGVTVTMSFYLPIYFQAVRGKDPIMSGVFFLPTIVSGTIVSVIAGAVGKYSRTPPCPANSIVLRTYILADPDAYTTADNHTVGKLGYYLPWTIAGGVLAAIGSGLLSMLTPTTPTSKWIGYQILMGAGRGLGGPLVSYHPFPASTLLSLSRAVPPLSYYIYPSIYVYLLTIATSPYYSQSLQSKTPSPNPKCPPACPS
jgi:hypothetical protein